MNKKQIDILNDYFLHSALRLISQEEQCLRRVCSPDLSIRELHVVEAVACLQADSRSTMAEIARYLHLSPASLTTAVNVLVKKGFLDREYSAEDRRVIYVRLTETGEAANRKYLDFVRNMLYEVSSDLDEDVADQMIEVLLRLSDYLDRALDE
ncbi:MAG: MarR family transcriptional regulator [Clostridia bacterium]|nr:MarR family transcriptional regulator [Clostridia bacterium]MBQ9997247.1 MarR family transcriptional regulator [Clostridia bacterium]